MSLPAGAFITTLDGKRCTAVPRTTSSSSGNSGSGSGSGSNNNDNNNNGDGQQDTTTSTTSTTSQKITTTSQAQIDPTILIPSPSLESTSTAPIAEAPGVTSQTPSPQSQQSVTGEGSFSRVTGQSTGEPATAATTNTTPAPSPLSEVTGTDLPGTTGADDGGSFPSQSATIGSAGGSLTVVPVGIGSDTSSTTPSAAAVSSTASVKSTVAVAGGVIGGVALISLLVAILWFWRRNMLKKRRSTLLTPLSGPEPSYRDEKGPYAMDQESVSPTPALKKVKALVYDNLARLRGRMGQVGQLVNRSRSATPSVNMNRGNSQFIEPASIHSRNSSVAISNDGDQLAFKDRVKEGVSNWWSRLKAVDIELNWPSWIPRRGDDNRGDPISSGRAAGTKGALGRQPDFLTLLGMDDRELDREAQRRRTSRAQGSGSSRDHFLGALGLDFSNADDPFSDLNAVGTNPAPLVVSNPSNPFSDANAVRSQPTRPKPATYVADIRRSRGQSVGGNTTRAPSTVYGGRESVASVETFATRRNKFRSDPFDLERPELLGRSVPVPAVPVTPRVPVSNTSSLAGTAGSSDVLGRMSSRMSSGVGIQKPGSVRTRAESMSSKYSSGISMGDWSDPGPDVGPAGAMGYGPSMRESPTQGWRDRQEREQQQQAAGGHGGKRKSGASVVGKAL